MEFVLKIGESSFPPFSNYGKGTLSAVYFKGAEEDYPAMAQLGFAAEVNPTYGYDPSV